LSQERILLVEDDESHRRTLDRHMSASGYSVLAVESAEAALNRIHDFQPDIIVTDVQMDGMDGFELLRRVRETLPDVDVVVITGYAGVQGAIDAMKDGAYDYLVKPLDLDQLDEVLERCIVERQAPEGTTLRGEADALPASVGGLVGRHPAMMEVFKRIGTVAASRAAVLIQGETGTGKELIARTIHANSAYSDEPFVAVNCAAVPENLLESELFGHVKGAFTGATSDRLGRFELAGDGTIFLDEIGDTTLAFQSKLLRVLQEREFYPVGGEELRRTRARVVAATHQSLKEHVRDGSFREDLYFRLQVIEIHVPPLRERRSDIPLLVRHILAKASADLERPVPALPPEVMAELLSRDWTGNVRELENTLTRAIVLCRGPSLSMRDIGGRSGEEGVERAMRPLDSDISDDEGDDDLSLDAMERRYVQQVLLKTGGNKSAAARILEISRPRLDRMIDRHRLVF
jgi:DNA-binding NtrC family response regulator